MTKAAFTQALSALHQRLHMRRNRAGEPLEVVAAFEQADDAPTAGFRGDLHHPAGGPGEILGLETQVCERIAPVRVKSG
jgi:hypothetical protein